jgi:hypothetical protein
MSFVRSQVIWALWQHFAGPFHPGLPLTAVPKWFARSVSNLVERGAGPPDDRRSGQQGLHQLYEFGDVLELAIALDVGDLGLPQAETVLFLRTFRAEIRRQLMNLPDKVVYGKLQPHLFMVMRPRAMKRAIRSDRASDPALMYAPIAFERPEFITGRKALVDLLVSMSERRDRKRIIIELADLVTDLRGHLDHVPEAHRGRG